MFRPTLTPDQHSGENYCPHWGLDACKMPVTSSPLGFGFSELRGFHVLAKQPHRATVLQGLQASFPAILLTSPNHGHEAEGFWSQHRQYSAGQRSQDSKSTIQFSSVQSSAVAEQHNAGHCNAEQGNAI